MTWFVPSLRACAVRHWLVVLAAAMFPALAHAQSQGYASKWVNLRAGPDRDYPLVARVPPGAPLFVQGCVPGYVWCDVVGPNNERGWIYAANIDYPYQSSNVPVLTYGAVIGLPIVSFVIGDYWGRYYPQRPWYSTMPRWEHRPPPHYRPPSGRPPPRPPITRPPGPPPRPPMVRPPDRPRPPPSITPPRPQPQPPMGGPRPGGGGAGGGGPRPGRPGGPGGAGGGGGPPQVERPAPR